MASVWLRTYTKIVVSVVHHIWDVSARENKYFAPFATHYFTNSSISFNCRIIISGASGGVSRINKVQSKADQIRALVHLVVNETLFIISGQMGSSVCQGFGEVSLWIFFIIISKAMSCLQFFKNIKEKDCLILPWSLKMGQCTLLFWFGDV